MKMADVLMLPAHQAAPLLLGGLLSVGEVALRITETEAYQGAEDKASHAARGLKVRNAPMFKAGGSLYVYLSYGMHWCLNIVTGYEGEAHAVLIRAGEVVKGQELARRRRKAGLGVKAVHLARGPGNLTRALALDGSFNAEELGERVELSLAHRSLPYRQSSRIGITTGMELPWRFYLDHPSVSKMPGAKPSNGSRGVPKMGHKRGV